MNEARALLEIMSRVLWRCAVLGVALTLVWYLVSVFASDWICGLHGTRFGLTAAQCAVVNYTGIAFVKCMTYLFFLVPWLAIRWVLRGSREG